MRAAPRKITAWIVAFALLFVALGPAFVRVSSAWAGDSPAWGEICTSQGLVRAGDAGAQPADDAGSAGAHARVNCLCCLTQHLGFALPPATQTLVPSAEFSRMPASSAWLLPRPSIAWSPSRPRGPPIVS
jgi:hypothetical protein